MWKSQAWGDVGIAPPTEYMDDKSIPKGWEMIPGRYFGGFSQKISGRFQGLTSFDTKILHFVNFFPFF